MTNAQLAPAPHTLARATDPSTSREAAARVAHVALDHYRAINEAMAGALRPLGAEEIAVLTGIDAYRIRKRLPEMAGLEPTDQTRTTSSGRRERLWRLKPG